MYPYILQGTNLSIFIDGVLHQFGSDHVSYSSIIEAIKTGDQETVKTLVDAKKAIEKFSKGNVTIEGDTVMWHGQVMHGALTERMVAMLREGFDINPLVNFMERLMKNPSKRAVDEAYMFFEACNLPITPDGYFLAFKKVRDDYRDVHSGTVCNKPAHLMDSVERATFTTGVIGGKKRETTCRIVDGNTVVSMPRNMVDDERDNTCSEGLHFCSKSYLSNFGGSRIVVLKIDPADVVSIPSDYNNAKGRCSSYIVVDELKVDANEAFTKPVQETANGSVKPAQASRSPKTGSSYFYRGYSAGYAAFQVNGDYDEFAPDGWNLNYAEGYEKGWDDAADEMSPRYQYVGNLVNVTPPTWTPKGW